MMLTFKPRYECEGRGKHRRRIATYYRAYEGDRYICAVFKVPGGYRIYHEGGGASFGTTRAKAVDNFVKGVCEDATEPKEASPGTVHA